MPDFVTVLQSLDKTPCTKRVGLSGTTSAPLVKWYQGKTLPVASKELLGRVLDKLAEAPTALLVRGGIADGVDVNKMRRAHKADPTLVSAVHHWIQVDLDKYLPELAPAEFAAQPHKYAAMAAEALAPGAWYHWLATSSAGVKPGARLRLTFWFAAPTTDDEARAWAESRAIPCDLSLYTPSQPHYTSRPIVDEDCAPPIAYQAWGWVPGAEVVRAPLVPPGRGERAEDDLARAGRKLAKTEQGLRHKALNRTAYVLAQRYQEDELAASHIVEELCAACEKGGFLDGPARETATRAVSDGREAARAARAGWRTHLARDEKTDLLKPTAANASMFLEYHEAFAGKLAYDERALRPMLLEDLPWGDPAPRHLTEVDDTYAVEWFQAKCQLDVKASHARAGLVKASMLRKFDAIQDYLEALPTWDARDRTATFFIRHFGVEDTELHRAQAVSWFIQAYRRAYATVDSPIQADYTIILQDPAGGLRKTATLRALCPSEKYFRHGLPDLENKDSLQSIAGAWIVELAELTHKRAHQNAVKNFLTSTTDTFRPPYGRDMITVARRAVTIGTTNEHDFLDDTSGNNRRYWPMVCHGRSEVTEVLAEREQLWAEAKCRAERGELAYLSDSLEALARGAQAEFEQEQPLESPLLMALMRPLDTFLGVTVVGLTPSRHITQLSASQACQLVGVDPKQSKSLADTKRALRQLGWKEIRPHVRNAARTRTWVPPPRWCVLLGDREVVLQDLEAN